MGRNVIIVEDVIDEGNVGWWHVKVVFLRLAEFNREVVGWQGNCSCRPIYTWVDLMEPKQSKYHFLIAEFRHIEPIFELFLLDVIAYLYLIS